MGFTTSDDPGFSPDLATALEDFQLLHSLRHADGIFGQLTYVQMYNLHRLGNGKPG